MSRETLSRSTKQHIRTALLAALIVAALLLCASCAPRDISSGGGRVDAEYYGSPGPDTSAEMRYPTTGSLNYRREKNLYNMSNPSYFEAVQEWRTNEFKRRMKRDGTSAAEHPSYRETPRQKSPFRE